MKKPFSEPKIYTGGIDTERWSELSEEEKKAALSKRWYVYFSYRDPKTGKLKRQTPISRDANQHKNMQDRMTELRILQRNLKYLLERGANPYANNEALARAILNKPKSEEQIQQFPSPSSINTAGAIVQYHTPTKNTITKKPATTRQHNMATSVAQPNNSSVISLQYPLEQPPKTGHLHGGPGIKEAIQLALDLKEKQHSQNSFPKFKSNVNQFKKWLEKEGLIKGPTTSLDKIIVIRYLNTVLQRTSARTRNNVRVSLSGVFQVWEDNELIPENFVPKINVLKTVPTRHKSYTPEQETKVLEYTEQHDPLLLFYIQFMVYAFLRPIEVCRLKIKDLDLKDRKIYVKAKNNPVKIKILPEILLSKIPSLHQKDPNDYLFTPTCVGGVWDTSEDNKRNYFSRRFKKVKDALGLGKNYGLYSFRHTYISKLYRELSKNAEPMEVKSKLMLITGHTTLTALEKYLREIDAELPEDFSDLLRKAQQQ